MLFRRRQAQADGNKMHEWDDRSEMLRRTAMATVESGRTSKQNLRLLIALSLLIVALAVVLVKDRDFWFGSEQAVESDAASQSVAKTVAPAKSIQSPVTSAAVIKNHNVAKSAIHTAVAAKEAAVPASTESTSPVVASKRVVLPPLDVEVVAGDTHRTIHPGSNVAKVEIPGDSNRVSTVTASLPANAAARERLSAVSAPELRETVDSTLPLLGQHSRVQGSVVLQAVIGADGNIENLRVLSGPAILATAAQQAVRQWRFKPYVQNGQAVETKTTITVNFSIRVSDPAKTS
jgi:TonB family protein